MPHATKKSTRPRRPAALSTPVQYPRAQQSSSSTTGSHAYTWTATDAARASRDGAFLTAWPRDESYYTPPVHLLDQGCAAYQGQSQSQSNQQQQQQLQLQYYYSSRNKPSTTTTSGGASTGK
ncbi:hypothetical protein F4821DRAFT_253648 [Hypoxylon rubiginosum]|uniref:Uncharacterized protein n=1 Tax=Hypoxylon rubiginosum TaxID=110542 RepID=A0ACC0DJG0_9PEZI|nr:hypothetical protein F4821DRAFT_253648 [Hypoxylon rubiginosum]